MAESVGIIREAPLLKKSGLEKKELLERYWKELDMLLNEWQIMPESFLMPSDYQFQRGTQKENEFEKAKRNKLRTAWFSGVFGKIELIERRCGLRFPEAVLIREDYEALTREIRGETDAVFIKTPGAKLVAAEEMREKMKEIERQRAPVFLDRKRELIGRVEALVGRIMNKLELELAGEALFPSVKN
jgi:hypothetical protein